MSVSLAVANPTVFYYNINSPIDLKVKVISEGQGVDFALVKFLSSPPDGTYNAETSFEFKSLGDKATETFVGVYFLSVEPKFANGVSVNVEPV